MVIQVRRFDLSKRPDFREYKKSNDGGISKSVRIIGATAAKIGIGIAEREANTQVAADKAELERQMGDYRDQLIEEAKQNPEINIAEKMNKRYTELTDGYKKEKNSFYKAAFDNQIPDVAHRLVSQAEKDAVEMNFYRTAEKKESEATNLSLNAREKPEHGITYINQFLAGMDTAALPVATKYKLMIAGKKRIASAMIEGLTAVDPAETSRDLIKGKYKDYFTIDEAKKLARQADEDDFYRSLEEGDFGTVRRKVDELNAKGAYANFPTYDEKDRAGLHKIIDSLEKKETDLRKKGHTQEGAHKKSIEQMVNSQVYEEKWKEDKNRIGKSLYELLEFRAGLQETLNKDGLSESDYAKLHSKTVPALLKLVENYSPSWFLKKNFEQGVSSLDDVLHLKGESPETRAYVFDELYSELKARGINPDSREQKDKIPEIVQKIKEEYLKNRNTGVLKTEAAKVVLGTKMYDYKGDGKKKQNPVRRIVRDKTTGVLYAQYKDKDGIFSDKSIIVRLPNG